MRRKGFGVVGGILLLGLILPVAAQEPTQPPIDETAGEQKKQGFWDRFPLYLEVQAGRSAAEEIGTSVSTTDVLTTESFVEIDEQDNVRFAVGWTLPEEKGQFRLTFNSYRETGYAFRSQASRLLVSDPQDNSNITPKEPAVWWNVSIEDGVMTSRSQVPEWSITSSDSNGDGQVDPDEIAYTATPFGTVKQVTPNLDNQVQWADVTYERLFGGRKYAVHWGAGLRYFAYEGNMPTAAWIDTGFRSTPQFHGGYQGFTDGVLSNIISLHTDSRGIGPTGKAIFQIKFFRERLKLLFGVNAAFLVQSSEVESAEFYTRVRESTAPGPVPAPARISEDRDKDVWHTGAEAGINFEVLPGLTLMLSYYRERYADAVLLPTSFSIPETFAQADQGVVALYNTRDFNIDGWRGGIGFQF